MKNHINRNGLQNDAKSFDPDKFLDMLHDKIHGKTDGLDDCYLDELIRTNPFARELYEDTKATYPGVRIRMRCKCRTRERRVLLTVFLCFTIGVIYALLYAPQRAKLPLQKGHGFYQLRIKEVIEAAQKQYKTRIVLDQAEIGNIRCSGALDPRIPLKDFLDYLTWSNGLEYYFDTGGVPHIKNKPGDCRSRDD